MSDAELLEVFEFLASDREDVRKMAAQGLAQHSKDNKLLTALLAGKDNAKHARLLVELVTPTKVATLGDVLSTLINVTCDASVVEVFVAHQLIDTLMRMLDGLARSESIPAPVVAALSEMTLMLLNNMTASHLAAVDDLLQVKDEDLRGFHISRLFTHYTRLADSDTGRRTAKWFVQICVNISRTRQGQEILANDDDWVPLLVELLGSESEELRLLASDAFRNMSFEKETHAKLIDAGLLKVCIQRLTEGLEKSPKLRHQLAETVAFMLQTERGMQAMENLNAKKLLTGALDALDEESSGFVRTQILPFLEDITDAYVVHGTSHDDLD